MSDEQSDATDKQLILMCASTLLGSLLRGELAQIGNLEVINATLPEHYTGTRKPDLILCEVTEASEASARQLLETSQTRRLVFIGPLGDRASKNDNALHPQLASSLAPRGMPTSRLSSAPWSRGLVGTRRDVRELSADVSVAEIVRVCCECLAGTSRSPAPRNPSMSSSPFQMLSPSKDNGGALTSLPAPLFPSSAPPSSRPSQRPSSGAPPLGGQSEDAEHESLFELDPELQELLDEAEQRVASRLNPRFTSPPDPAQNARNSAFILSPEVRAALDETVGEYEAPLRPNHGSKTPHSRWATRTGHGQRVSRTSEMSESTRDGETSIPTSSSVTQEPSPHPGPATAALTPQPHPTEEGERATTRPPPGTKPRTDYGMPAVPPAPGLPKGPWLEPPFANTSNSELSYARDAALTPTTSDHPPSVPEQSEPSATANGPVTPDTSRPRRATARAVPSGREPGLHRTSSAMNENNGIVSKTDGSQPDRSKPVDGGPDMYAPPPSDALATAQPNAPDPGSDYHEADYRPTLAPKARRTVQSANSPDPAPEAIRSAVQSSPGRNSEIPPLREGDAIQLIARSIRTRYTGAIAVEAEGGVRRIVMRDGDFVTAASGLTRESLLSYLVSQGTLAANVAQQLGHRLPNFGRHAGAALIAAGHLTQEQMWPSLRAHAEYIITAVLALREGLAGLEEQVPERLAAEPAVFGGATGAEVLIELIRRTVSPELAIARLGGTSSKLSPGVAYGLLEECALSRSEHEALERLVQGSLSEHLSHLPYPEFPSVLYALCQLRVIKSERQPERAPAPAKATALDEQAIRQLVANRKALVEDANYFELLGVSPSSTAYDIRRAYLALKRTFDPATILTAATVDLSEDVDLIRDVLDEAYDILHDQVRRDRYRAAILSVPEHY